PSGLIPAGPQGRPKVTLLAPPLQTQLRSNRLVAGFHLHSRETWSPSAYFEMRTASPSTWLARLVRRAVRPSWVASHTTERCGVRPPRLSEPLPALLSLMASV